MLRKPAPFTRLRAYSFGYVVCGVAAGVSAVLVLSVLRADPHHDADELAEAEAQQYREAKTEPQYA